MAAAPPLPPRPSEGGTRPRWRPLAVPEGERIVLSIRPHPLFILLHRLGWLLTTVVIGLVGAWLAAEFVLYVQAAEILFWAVVVLALQLLWETLDWATRSYVLTERRVIGVRGIFRRYGIDAELEAVQHVALYKSLRERIFGLGTVGFATAGTGWTEVWWLMIAEPNQRIQIARDTLKGGPGPDSLRAMRGAAPALALVGTGGEGEAEPARRVPVIGLAGGIGAGKSAAGAAFARLGCVVIDSDREAREALNRPEVREVLRRWWGDAIIGSDGTVDRRAVAGIVFRDSAERARLEALIHPLVKASRARLRAEAEGAGAAGVVVDAPLLFEAGVDGECDAVVFIDAPRAVRLERVARTRGWDAGELDRREGAQMPLDEKRRRSDEVVLNDGDAGALDARIAEVFGRIRSRVGARTRAGDRA